MIFHQASCPVSVTLLDVIDDPAVLFMLTGSVSRRFIQCHDQRATRDQFDQIVRENRIAGRFGHGRWNELASRTHSGWGKRSSEACSCLRRCRKVAMSKRLALTAASRTMDDSSIRLASKISRVCSGVGAATLAPRLGRSSTMWSCARLCKTLRTVARLALNSSQSEASGSLVPGFSRCVMTLSKIVL